LRNAALASSRLSATPPFAARATAPATVLASALEFEVDLKHGPTEGSCWMKVLVVSDAALIREALGGVVKELKDDITVLEAADSRQAIEIVAAEQADLGLILLDLNLPDRDRFTVLSELRKSYPAISVVVLSAQQDRNTVDKALDFGALGFIPKSDSRDLMLGALRRLMFAGGICIPPKAIVPEEP
jgi:DNA-binding NarL/FixJ family response regulator